MSLVEGRAILAMGQDFQDDSQAESRDFDRQPTTLWQGDPLFDVQARKVASILDSCNSGDLETLVGLATSEHGLVEDDVRKIACMVAPFHCYDLLLTCLGLQQGQFFSDVAKTVPTLSTLTRTGVKCQGTGTRTKLSWMSIDLLSITLKVCMPLCGYYTFS